jgi:hypothetical protein
MIMAVVRVLLPKSLYDTSEIVKTAGTTMVRRVSLVMAVKMRM